MLLFLFTTIPLMAEASARQPQLCITAVALPGTEQGTVGNDGERFIDNKRITGAIPDMLEEAVEFVRKNSRTKTIITDNGQRADKPEYPIEDEASYVAARINVLSWKVVQQGVNIVQ